MKSGNLFVICINNDGFEVSLELRKLYQVVDDATASRHGQIRIVDESGEDYLYPEDFFVGIDLPNDIRAQVQNAA